MLPLIGEGVDRADGRLKVTGGARYAAEFPVPGLCHAVLVPATVGRGQITDIDTDVAGRLPGVIAVLSYKDQPGFKHVPPAEPGGASQMPGVAFMLTRDVHFYGQHVAVVVAETLDQAMQAARTLRVTYAASAPTLGLEAHLAAAHPPKNGKAKQEPADTHRGDVDAAVAGAAVSISHTYTTPNEAHNPMEMHATTAAWDGERLTLWDATQGVEATKAATETALGLGPDAARAINPFVGGGFGSKGTTWPHVALTAYAAKRVGRPVRMMLTRQQMFYTVGYRSCTRQTITLAAAADGTIVGGRHDLVSQTPAYSSFLETSAITTRHLYAMRALATSHRLVTVDTSQPSQMRAPGEGTGLAALEIAMDELAEALHMDPVELRLKNYAESDPEDGKPFSSKSLRQCYSQAAEKFGWTKRNPKPRTMSEGGQLVGYGMATATYPANRMAAHARVRAFADGTVVVQIASQDIGTGTYTILAQLAAAELGLPPDAVKTQLADTRFPKAPTSGGSATAATAGTAVRAAAAAVRDKLIGLAVADEKSPLHGVPADAIKAGNGALAAGGKSDPIREVVARSGQNVVEADGDGKPGPEMKAFSRHSFGAVFAEVRVDPQLGTVRVPRLVAAYAAGRILNAKTARSQFVGGLCFAHGMALLEETYTDPRTGRIANDNYAEYLVPTNADIGSVEVIQVPEDDPHVNPLGVKGIGEIGIVGAPAAIANAVYHATGKRVRDLPITPDKLI